MNRNFNWLRYDLHMHSYHSKKTKPETNLKDMSANEFVNCIIDKVDVFSITDHNYYPSKYYSDIRQVIVDKNISIIDGAELDVYVNDKDFFQMLVYFESNKKGFEIESIINCLYKNKKPNLSEIISKLLKLNIKFLLIPEGNKNRGVTKILDKLDKFIYKEITKYAMYKIFSGFDVKKNFDVNSQNIWALNYYKQTHSFNDIVNELNEKEINSIIDEINHKISDSNTKISCKANKIYEYVVQYSNYFAYFTFSDWHNADKYEPEINNFVFGSLETSFESFEIAVLDPVSRIKRSKEEKIIIPESIINTVKFDIKEQSHSINFSPGLNAIIGARGSGKSLLVAIIKRLFDLNDQTINLYQNSYEIKNIEGIDYGGITIKEGSLKSIAILEQSQIESIYKDPENAWKSIYSKFPNISELNMDSLTDINTYLHKINAINYNLKSVTTNIKQIKKTETYIYTQVEETSFENLELNIKNASKYLNNILVELEKIGFIINDFSVEINTIIEKIYNYKNIILKHNEIKTAHNERIKKINFSKTTLDKTNQKNRLEIKEAIGILKENLQKLLDFKKIEFLIDNFKFDVVPAEIKKEGKYIFITSYKIPDDLKDSIIEKVTSAIKKDRKKTDLDRLKSYVLGEIELLKDKKIVEEYDKFIKTSIFESKNDFYEISDFNYDLTQLSSNQAIKEAEEKKAIINLTNSSLGVKSVAYLDMLFDADETILLLDQPEDNIDNHYISQFLVPLIKSKKHEKQLIFVTHNPSVAVYGDAFNYIYATNKDGHISYTNYFIESKKDKDNIIKILEGGRPSFSNRNKKYGNVLGEEEYEVKN